MNAVGQLSGHQGEVLSIGAWDKCIVSGGSDGTVRLWDWPRGSRSVKCVFVGRGQQVSAVVSSEVESHRIFVAAECDVREYDLRKESVVLREFRWKNSLGSTAEDEVNSLAVNEKGTYLASCDDAGDVAVLDLSGAAAECSRNPNAIRWKRMRKPHSNIASSVAFRRGTAWELLSGSFDCTVVGWDFGRGKTTSKMDVNVAEDSTQVVNPPFVHKLEAENRYRGRVACALGSGDIVILDLGSSQPIVGRGTNVHLAAATTVAWGTDRLVSGGLDSTLVIWKAEPSSALEAVEITRHGEKINDVVWKDDSRIYVASQSSTIGIY
mmetsp:Transcript_28876/g.112460  ORF Transcript_28876/g.112460 Transcript_28876/m.112460 type:complete len:323 (-) Transcript_28876:791-1759(-)|eukprot:CAMPEP_0113966108 /NCGR_PEP_ID=MMETSP0011_2-20120614/8139_1 /TAXON_ID=101924 /ORGANISM="Rhodosorus marinus" /LENGTH=322 /DNA_ID=CAMNT_0000978739 /DNA_START=337 /DNA_END=1305 /DNA_ORIENTATION=- /assembly_acc=CAM_ASM_000156